MKEKIFFDFCGTLTATNNTYDFLYFYFYRKKKFLKFLIFVAIDNLNIFKNILPFIDKRKYELFLRKIIFKLLKGETKKEIYDEAANFVRLIIKKNFYQKQKLDEVIDFINKKNDVYILSSSIEPVIVEFFRYFKITGIKILSSKLIFDHKGNCKGKAYDYLYNKRAILEKEFNLNAKNKIINNSVFYTDNKEDTEIKNNFEKFVFLDSLRKNLNKSYTYTIKKNNYLFTYFPTLYYLMSRPLSLIFFILNEIIVFFIYFKSMSFTLIHYFIYQIFFLPIYEISSLINDYYAVKKEKNPTLRIENNIRYNFFLFVFIRLMFLAILIYLFNFKKEIIYLVFFSIFLTIIGIIHSHLPSEKRIFTMILLRFFKLTPFYFLVKDKIRLVDFLIISLIIQILPVIFYIYEQKTKFSLKAIRNLFFTFVILIMIAYIYLRVNYSIFLIIFYACVLRYLSFYNYLRKS